MSTAYGFLGLEEKNYEESARKRVAEELSAARENERLKPFKADVEKWMRKAEADGAHRAVYRRLVRLAQQHFDRAKEQPSLKYTQVQNLKGLEEELIFSTPEEEYRGVSL
jgi:hypothetical protein